MYNEADYMEDFYERIAKYDALVVDASDIIEQDMNKGIIKIDKSVFDAFTENTVIYIYCADIDADAVMEYVMTAEDNDGITMELLDYFSI